MLTLCVGPHTSDWIKSSLLRLRLSSQGLEVGVASSTGKLHRLGIWSATKFRQSENDVLRLHFSKPREVNMVEPLLPQVDIRLNLLPFGKHNSAYIDALEDEHPPFTTPLCDDFSLLFDEVVLESKSNMHSLVDYLSNRHQVLGYRRDMHDIPHNPFLADMAQGNVSDVLMG